jgi:DNA-binding response OmpR family regulator
MHERPEPGPPSSSVLIVEDDEEVARAIADVLGDDGYSPVWRGTLGEARATLREHTPSLIVLDLSLHEGFGGDLLEELADRADAPAVLIVSASVVATRIGDSYQVPVVTKPFAIADLSAAAEAAIAFGTRPLRKTAG